MCKCECDTAVANTNSEANKIQEETKLFERSNLGGCSFTDVSEFTLDKNSHVNKVQSWYSWNADENSTAYTITKDGKKIAEGKLVRSQCDPYQKQWCIAIDESFNKDLNAGTYILNMPAKRTCQNTTSEGKGYVTIWGYVK